MNRTPTRLLTFLLACAAAGSTSTPADSRGQAPSTPVPERLRQLPAGWSVISTVEAAGNQRSAFGQKLGGEIVRLSNTTLAVEGQQLRINLIDCKSEADAVKVQAAMLRTHQGNHTRCPREGRTVVEFVGKEPRLVERAYQELGFTPPKVTYEVSFRAAPLVQGDYMLWNKLFNACLAADTNERQVRDLARSFTFGDQIRVRRHGLGAAESTFAWTPRPRADQPDAEGETPAYTFTDLPSRYGLPDVAVRISVTSEAFALTPSRRKAGPELLAPTAFWPAADPDIVALARKITEGKRTTRERTAALLEWLQPGKNLRYGGSVTGSRYGVQQVLKQGHGHCWDFSDCFVAIGRASGVPCRQVLGWLHGVSGHVWAEVLIEGEGWRQVDPTAGMGCDCRYVPYLTSEDGRASLVYTSPVEVKVRP